MRFRAAGIIAGVTVLFATGPASAAGTVSAASARALDYMRELNVITFGNVTSSSDIEGKAFIGGDLSGGTIGMGCQAENGRSCSSKDGFKANTRATITVVGNDSGNTHLETGTNPRTGQPVSAGAAYQAKIGGNLSGFVDNVQPSVIAVGGNFDNNGFNPSSNKKVEYGGSASGLQTQDAPFVTNNNALDTLQSELIITRNDMKSDLLALSGALANHVNTASLSLSDRNNIQFTNFTPNSNFVYVTVAASALFGGNGTLKLDLPTLTGGAFKTTVITVTGSGDFTYNMNNNDIQNSNDSNLIWNFTGNVNLDMTTAWHGSILAPTSTFKTSTIIEGSVVAQSLTLNGEVHLGTFDGDTNIAAVPEATTWMMLILGFGGVGATLRRRPRMARAAAALAA